MIKFSVALYIDAKIVKSNQSATQADGKTPLKVVGEARVILCRDNHRLKLEALVVEDLDVDILGGMPFMELNDITIRTKRKEIIIGESKPFKYGDPDSCFSQTHNSVLRTRSFVLQAPIEDKIVWPDDFIEVPTPIGLDNDSAIAIEPNQKDRTWPCLFYTSPSPRD